MDWIEITVIVVASALVAFTLIFNIVRKIKGKSSCSGCSSGGGGCSGCNGCSSKGEECSGCSKDNSKEFKG